MTERNKSALGKKRSGVKKPQVDTTKATGNKPASGALPSTGYINRLRWDDKAKMFTVVDIPKKRVKKD
jgi:hypothetical protein